MSRTDLSKNAEVGDLVSWVDMYRNVAFGKVIDFDYRGIPIAREIYENLNWMQNEEGKWVNDGKKTLGYRAGHVVATNFFVVAKHPRNSLKVDENHPHIRARENWLKLEIGSIPQ